MTAQGLDELLREFLLRKDASAMEELVRRTRLRLLRVARRIGAPQDAEDTVQAAYHSLLACGTEWRGAPPLAWLITAVVRVAYRRKAITKRQVELARRLDRPRASPTPLTQLSREETRKLVRRAVVALPARYRDAVVLHHLEGMSTSEVARLLDLPRSTVTTRLRRGRRLLRRSLPIRLVHAALLVPWLVQDAARAGTTLTSGIGAIMNTKTVATVIVVGLASGVTGYGAANLVGASKGTVTRATRADSGRRELEVQLERAKDEVQELRKLARDSTADESSAKAHQYTALEHTKATRKGRPARAKVWEAAQVLKVSPEAMKAAIRAERAVASNADDMYDLINELKRFGEDGFRAALAIVRGGQAAGQPQGKLLEATYLAGLEGLLLDTLDSAEVGSNAKFMAIMTLAKADTPAVRDYLVQRIETEKNRMLFWGLTMALGSLKEPRAAAAIGKKLIFDDPIKEADWKPLRLGMLWQLSQMGGEDAKNILRDFVSDARVTRGEEITQALNSLAILDKPLCGELAHQILQEPRGKALSEEHEQRVRDFLGFRQR